MESRTAFLKYPLAVLLPVILGAQTPSPSVKPGTVEGTVTNSVNGEPVRKATVRLDGGERNYQTATDVAGHFEFDRVNPGSYLVRAFRDGFADSNNNRRPQSIAVAEAQNLKDIKVTMDPMAHVSGHVLDEDGDPIMLASVQALRCGFVRGHTHLSQAGFASSNDLGEFQFLNLIPGRYYFLASAQRRAPYLPPRTRFSGQQMAFPPTYYPEAPDPTQATVSDVAPGAEISNINFHLHKVPTFHLRGKVVDQAGQPRSANLNLYREHVGLPFPPSIAADGSFDLPVVPGSYYLTARSDNLTAHDTFTVSDQDINGVVIALSAGLTISGRFTVEGTAPQINGQVLLQNVQGLAGVDSNGQVQQDGTFVIHNAWPGSYFIDVFNGTPGLYVKSIHFGDADVSNGLLALSQENTSALNIALGSDGGQVQGVAQKSAGEPSGNITVTLAPAADLPGRNDLIKQARTDANGNFHFQDVAPGEYQVFAWEDFDMDVVESADFRKALSSHAASVSIAPNGHESVQVQWITAEEADAEKNKLP